MNNIIPDGPLNFTSDDFFHYTVKRQVATLELISQILFFADRAARRAFGRDTVAKDFDRVDQVQHSANWGCKLSSMSLGTQVIIRKDMERAGLLKLVAGFPRWSAGKCRSPITILAQLDLKGLAQLARRLFQSIVAEVEFEGIDREHHWGSLAAIVVKLTGCSLFSMDDDYTPDEAETERRKAERLLQAYAEMGNWQWGGTDYRSLVEERLCNAFGPDWPDLLPF